MKQDFVIFHMNINGIETLIKTVKIKLMEKETIIAKGSVLYRILVLMFELNFNIQNKIK
jgi:hypothetical protein